MGLEWSQTRCILPDSAKGKSSFLRRFSQQGTPRPCLYLTSSSVHSVGFCSGPGFHSSIEDFRVDGANDTIVLLSLPVAEMSMEQRFHWNPFCVALLLPSDMCHSNYEHENHKLSLAAKKVFTTLSVFISFIVPRMNLMRSIKFNTDESVSPQKPTFSIRF